MKMSKIRPARRTEEIGRETEAQPCRGKNSFGRRSPPMTAEIARHTRVGHYFIKTRLHLRGLRQRDRYDTNIQQRIAESQCMERLDAVFLVVDYGYRHHPAVFWRVYAEPPGPQISDRILAHGKRRSELSH